MRGPTAYIALGSNIEAEANLPRAVRALDRAAGVAAASKVYETDPVDAPGTPRFLNAAVALRWSATPHRLRAELLRPIETRLGRVRTGDPNAPRTIDLDLVFVPGLVLEDPAAGLWLPDPELARRPHLAVPLADIAAQEVLPDGYGTVGDVAARLAAGGIRARPDISLR